MTLLDDLEAAERAATPAPWESSADGRHGYVFGPPQSSPDGEYRNEDAVLIALARNALPALLAVARAAEGRDGCAELCVAMTPYRGCTCGHAELAAALAALEKLAP